jgi:hypothetical protein
MWSNEGVRTFIDDLLSNACLWDGHCADYKNRNKKAIQFILLQKNIKPALMKLGNKLTISKVSFGDSLKILASKKTGSSPKKPSWLN